MPLPEEVTFNKHIRPILSENCFACHGFDKEARKAKLRLDVEESAMDVIVPGKSAESELIIRIEHTDKDEIMPPPKVNKKLTAHEKALLKKWVDQGAKYEPHWAFLPPKRAPVPDGDGHPIDRYVLARVDSEGLTMSPQEKAHTLIRRLYFDLIGLPPTAEQAMAFTKNPTPENYERIVDELLASPHFGERLAIPWLDLVRYADTVGYHGDQNVSVSPYRDYVINAFNSNKRFDVFTREQIAGDLFPNATEEQKIASGFNRLNMTTEEGGSQPKEYLAKYASDRVRTTSTVFMGATLGCAECHDHKFDPYTMKDFYSFAAFFADVQEVGVYSNRGRPPEMVVMTAANRAEAKRLEGEIAKAEAKLKDAESKFGDGQRKWELEIAEQLKSSKPFDYVWIDDEHKHGGKTSGAWNFVGKDKAPVTSGTKSRRQENGGSVQHFFNNAKEPLTLGAGDKFFFNVWLDPKKPPMEIMFQVHAKDHGGWEHRVFWGEDVIPFGGVGTKGPNHRPKGALPGTGKWVRLEATLEDLGFKPGQKVDGMSFDQFGGLAYWDAAGIHSASGSLKLKSVPQPVIDAVKIAPDTRNDAQKKALAEHYRSMAPEFKPLRDEIAKLKKQKDNAGKKGTKTLITVSKNPREMRVLPRGNWLDDSGEVVKPAFPQFLAKTTGDETKILNRMDLANWLVSPDHPLTARVFVNRIWKQLFGTGISKVLDDVGSQGEWPVHPELLDWLALEFIESGWDIKKLIKTIVTTETYQQSSRPRKELKETDPYNRLLARQSRFRLDAELVRDNFLAVSNLLVRDIGGSSARPYQPAGLYRHLNFPRRKYEPSKDQNQWRRGLYTHWQRTFLHPMLKAFDAPSRDECAADRPRSNTPLQALALLNDPSQVEAARAFASRIAKEPEGDFDAKLRWAYHQSLTRNPTPAEVRVLKTLYDRHLAKFKADANAAGEYLKTGMAPVAEVSDTAQHAAWMSVARALFNIHEMITRY